MTLVHLDKVLFSTLHEAYKNYSNQTGAITIPAGTMADGTTNNYSFVAPYSRGGTRADLYLEGNSVKILANTSTKLITGGPYQFKEFETASILIAYSSSNITITISIFNGNGHSITLISQSINVLAVEYDAPITAI